VPNIVESYECEVCKKVYRTEDEAKKCEDRCNDICDFKIEISTKHNFPGVIEINFNYNTWKDIFNSEDIFYVDCEYMALTLDELDEFIGALIKLKDTYRLKKVKRKANKLLEEF
jgi:hypothetical protein